MSDYKLTAYPESESDFLRNISPPLHTNTLLYSTLVYSRYLPPFVLLLKPHMKTCWFNEAVTTDGIIGTMFGSVIPLVLSHFLGNTSTSRHPNAVMAKHSTEPTFVHRMLHPMSPLATQICFSNPRHTSLSVPMLGDPRLNVSTRVNVF